MIFSKTVRAGGVVARVSSNFDEDRELKYQIARGMIELCRDLQAAGYLKIHDKIKTGDYTQQLITLEFPECKTQEN